jgi:two-component system NarL family response regulator
MPQPIGLVIVDEHASVRHALAMRLGAEPGFAVLGEEADAEAAIHLIEQTRPQVALVEIKRGDGRGLELVTWIALSNLGTQVIVLTSYPSEWEHWAVRRAGGKFYLLKDIGTPELIRQIWLAVESA